MNLDPNGGYSTALALSNAVGLRPFLTLALTALAVHLHWLHPSTTYVWMGERNVCIVLGVLAVLEFLGDKIPAVDHALHAVHFATKPIAAVLVSGGALASSDPNAAAWATMAGSVLNSLGIHGLVATTRAASTSFTVGAANPFVSLFEDVLTVAAVAMAAFLPFVGAVIAVLAIILAAVMLPRIVAALRRRRAGAA
jgi:uncharacterized membrane protein